MLRFTCGSNQKYNLKPFLNLNKSPEMQILEANCGPSYPQLNRYLNAKFENEATVIQVAFLSEND